MPSDKSLVKANNGYPAQTFHPSSSSYQETHGSNNAAHMKLVDNNGQPIDPREVNHADVLQRLDAIEQKLNGTLETQLTGSNVEDGSPVSGLSYEIDENGYPVMRVVDAAPFAYDPVADRIKVQTEVTRKTGFTVDTVVSNQIVGAGTNFEIDVAFSDESEVWVGVAFDQQPWTLYTGSVHSTQGSYSTSLFPELKGMTTTHPISAPAMALHLPFAPNTAMGITPPTTLDEARNFVTSQGGQTYRFRLKNDSATDGNLTLKIFRVWR